MNSNTSFSFGAEYNTILFLLKNIGLYTLTASIVFNSMAARGNESEVISGARSPPNQTANANTGSTTHQTISTQVRYDTNSYKANRIVWANFALIAP